MPGADIRVCPMEPRIGRDASRGQEQDSGDAGSTARIPGARIGGVRHRRHARRPGRKPLIVPANDVMVLEALHHALGSREARRRPQRVGERNSDRDRRARRPPPGRAGRAARCATGPTSPRRNRAHAAAPPPAAPDPSPNIRQSGPPSAGSHAPLRSGPGKRHRRHDG